VRILREVLVSRMALAAGSSAADHRARAAAEQRLHRSQGPLKAQWSHISELRNKVAHANQGRTPAAADLAKVAQAFEAPGDLLQAVAALVADPGPWAAAAATRGTGAACCLLTRGAPVAADLALRVEATLARVEQQLSEGEVPKRWQVARKPAGEAPPVLDLPPKLPKGVPGVKWAERMLEEAGKKRAPRVDPFAQRHAVLCPDIPVGLLAHLCRALEARGVLPWRLEPGSPDGLEPLFDRGVLEWQRGIPRDSPSDR
jgi:hypothetical protein